MDASTPQWKIESLQAGIVTQGLKQILDALNERPLSGKKVISASAFIGKLEVAFRQRVSRQQQDAQEFLQVIAERLSDEYDAVQRSRGSGQADANVEDTSLGDSPVLVDPQDSEVISDSCHLEESKIIIPGKVDKTASPRQEDISDGFPLQGEMESTIECLTCGWTKSVKSTFCTLTLNVPQKNTTLSSCFDGTFKTEHIEDYRCDRCRLVHAQQFYESLLKTSSTAEAKTKAEQAIALLQQAIKDDPEKPPVGVELPDIQSAPRRRIAKSARMTKFPRIIAVHLSRSIFDTSWSTLKNGAKVNFEERLALGGLLDQHTYRLSSVVCHKGSHFCKW